MRTGRNDLTSWHAETKDVFRSVVVGLRCAVVGVHDVGSGCAGNAQGYDSNQARVPWLGKTNERQRNREDRSLGYARRGSQTKQGDRWQSGSDFSSGGCGEALERSDLQKSFAHQPERKSQSTFLPPSQSGLVRIKISVYWAQVHRQPFDTANTVPTIRHLSKFNSFIWNSISIKLIIFVYLFSIDIFFTN